MDVYSRPGSIWNLNQDQTAVLTGSDSVKWDSLGGSVAVDGNGDTIVAAAAGKNDYAGALYLYKKPNAGWQDATQNAELSDNDLAAGDSLGSALAISSDGSVIAAGAYDHTAQGAVYMFDRPVAGWATTTKQTAELTSSNADAGSLGTSVAMTPDASIVVAGAAEGGPNDAGEAYVFDQPQNGWANETQTSVIQPADGKASDIFGTSVAISDDGSTIAVGSRFRDNYAGAVYVYGTPPVVQPQTISFTGPVETTVPFASSPFTVSAKGGASGNPVTFSVDPTSASVCSAGGSNGQSISMLTTGTCEIDANQAGDSAFTAASQVAETFTIVKGTPQLSWGPPAAITYGTPLSSTQLDAKSSVAGAFQYSPSTGAVLSPGTNQTLMATFTPTNTADYVSGGQTTTSITVTRATPQLSWATPAAITYGSALSSTQLDAKSSVAGNFQYRSATGTVFHAGAHPLTATFTPSNTTDYVSGGTTGATVTVNQAPLKITAQAQSVVFGATMPALTDIISGFVNNNTAASLSSQPVCHTTATSASGKDSSPAGIYPITCSGATDSDYAISYVAGTLTVSRAPVTLTYVSPSHLTRNGQGKVSGTFAATLKNSVGVGIAGRTVTFTLNGHSCTGTSAISGSVQCSISNVAIAAETGPSRYHSPATQPVPSTTTWPSRFNRQST